MAKRDSVIVLLVRDYKILGNIKYMGKVGVSENLKKNKMKKELTKNI